MKSSINMLWSTYCAFLVMYSPITAASLYSSTNANMIISRFIDVRGGSVDFSSNVSEVPVSRTRSRLFSSSLKTEVKKDSDSNGLITSSISSLKEKHNGPPLKVLFLSADTGGGHRASAESLANQFERHYPGSTYDLVDVWTKDGCLPYRTLVNAYKHLSAHPKQWKFLYHISNTSPYLLCTDIHSSLTCERKIRKTIASYNPDIVVSVHPTMQNVPLIATRKIAKKLGKIIPFVTVVTDFGSGHCHWFHKHVDRTYVASDRIRKLAKRRGRVPDEKLVQIGLPIRYDFAVQAEAMKERTSDRGKRYQAKIRKQLHISTEKKMVLVMGGGEGVGSLSSIVDSLYAEFVKQGIDATIVVVCGRNEKLVQDLKVRDWDKVCVDYQPKESLFKRTMGKILPSYLQLQNSSKTKTNASNKGIVDVVGLGFVSNMAEYMVAADILVTKAGPGTIAEAAALGLPVMLTSYLPGQEAGNLDIVLDGGFGDYCANIYGIAEEVACWLKDEALLEVMSRSASAVGAPNAASDIVLDIGKIAEESLRKNIEFE